VPIVTIELDRDSGTQPRTPLPRPILGLSRVGVAYAQQGYPRSVTRIGPTDQGGASAMPHNAFFGVSNYVTATVAIVIVVVVVVAVWWLRSRRK